MIEKNTLTYDEYAEIITNIGWKLPSKRLVTNSLKNSTTVKCIEDNKTIGMARLISDKGYMGFIADVAVLKEYRKKGIGTALVKELLNVVKNSLEEDESILIELLAAPGKTNFYRELGFKDNIIVVEKGMYQWIEK